MRALHISFRTTTARSRWKTKTKRKFRAGRSTSCLKAVILSRGHSALVGKSAVFAKKIGKGTVVMLGTLPEEKELFRIIRKAACLSGAASYDVDEGIMVTKRAYEGKILYFVASVGGKAGEFRFRGEWEDLLSGERYKNKIELSPYELHILKKV